MEQELDGGRRGEGGVFCHSSQSAGRIDFGRVVERLYQRWPRTTRAWMAGLLLFILPPLAGCEEAVAPSESGVSFKETANQTFVEVWETIGRTHYANQSDSNRWVGVKEEYAQLVEACSSPKELIETLNRMLGALGQSHMLILPPMAETAARLMIQRQVAEIESVNSNQSTTSFDNATARGADVEPSDIAGLASDNHQTSRDSGRYAAAAVDDGGLADVGLRLCLVEGRVRVLEAKHGRAAAMAGIRPGDLLVSINGLTFDERIAAEVPLDVLAEAMTLGRVGTEISVEFVNANDEGMLVNLRREAIGASWFSFGIMPPMPDIFQYRDLPGDIAYARMSSCVPGQISKFRELLPQINQRSALIIDLRNNPGGMLLFTTAMGGWLSQRQIDFGTTENRQNSMRQHSNPQRNAFTGPLAILVNHGTASAAEIFAAGMMDAGRAIIVGETTMGACLASVFFELSTGYRLQAVTGKVIRSNGDSIEGVGVSPNYLVTMRLEDLRQGRDTVLEAARQHLISSLDPPSSKRQPGVPYPYP